MGLKNLLTLKNLSKSQIEKIIDLGLEFKKGKSYQTLTPTFYCPVFLEPSTRTMLSFETAAKKLGLKTLNFNPGHSSTLKGETLYDTLKTIESMGTKVAVVRLKQEGILGEIAEQLDMKIVNAGEGTREHPTQALLDAMTIYDHFGRLENLTVSIIGDIKHSRVASSFVDLYKNFEGKLNLFSPPEFGEFDHEFKNPDFEECLKNSDVVMLLRNQLERHEKTFITSEDYNLKYGMTLERLKQTKKNAIIMHPGPFNRGVELDSEILNDPKIKIWDQVTNGVYARMAVLSEVFNG